MNYQHCSNSSPIQFELPAVVVSAWVAPDYEIYMAQEYKDTTTITTTTTTA